MRGAVLFATALVLAVVPGLVLSPSSVAPPTVLASPPSLVVVTVSPEEPQPGENATADAYVLNGTAAADAEGTPTFSMITGYQSTPLGPVERVGTGHYRAPLPIPGPEPFRGFASAGQSTVVVIANVSGEPAYGYRQFAWISEGVWLRGFVNRTLIMPGDPVHLRVEAYNGSERTDAQGVLVRIRGSWGAILAEYAPNRTGVGTYEVNFTAPAFSPPRNWITITAHATLRGLNVTRYIRLEIPRYQTWYHQTSANDTVSRGELLVADPWGHPAPGVNINVTQYTGRFLFLNATTDAEGRVALELDGGASHVVSVSVSVGRGNPLEDTTFQFTYYLHGYPWTHVVPVDPPMIADGSPRDFLRPGASVIRQFRAVNFTLYNEVKPIPAAEIYYYAKGPRGLVGMGRVVSDPDGAFSIAFTAPEGDVEVEFLSPAFNWATASYQASSPRLGMRVSALQLGGPTTVSGLADEALEHFAEIGVDVGGAAAPSAAVSVTLLNPAPGERWEQWQPDYPYPSTFLGDADEGLSNTLYLPSFLPQNGSYAVSVAYASSAGVKHQFAVLGAGESASIAIGQRFPSASDGLVWILLGVIAAMAAVSAGAFLVMWRRRGPRPPPSLGAP